MPFKRGDVVVYTGEEPRFPDKDRIGSVGIVVKVTEVDNVRVHWFWDTRDSYDTMSGVFPKNLKKLGEVDYDAVFTET